MLLREEWDKLLKSEKKIYIYGAGKYGRKLFRQLKIDGKADCVYGFLVSDKTKNPEFVEEKPIVQVSYLKEKDCLILIAVSDQYQDEIISTLEKLHLKKYVNAYKYTFLEYEDKSAVEVVEVGELIQKQYDKGAFCRLDIIVRLLAVEEYFGENDFGMVLYRKMQDARIQSGYADIAEGRFKRLIESWNSNGYDTDSQIVVNENLRIIDGSHRFALALYFGLAYLKVRKINESATTNFGLDWFAQHFESSECKRIVDKYNLVLEERKYDQKNKEEKLREEVYVILGKNQDFGRGQFYQSLEEIGINGQRPTEKRIEIYGLESLIKEKSVLDIGSNCGFIDIRLGLVAKSIRGIEYNGLLVKIAEKVKRFLGRQNVHFEKADFKEYETNEKYDVIFSFAVHQWIGLPVEKYCKKIKQMLKEGGYLVFESQDIMHDTDFEKYCFEFEENGLERIKDSRICDDGQIERRFVIYKYKAGAKNGCISFNYYSGI